MHDRPYLRYAIWKVLASVRWDVYILCCVLELGGNSDGRKKRDSRARTKTKFCRRRSKINAFRGSTICACRCQSAGLCAYFCLYVCVSARHCHVCSRTLSIVARPSLRPESLATFSDLRPQPVASSSNDICSSRLRR